MNKRIKGILESIRIKVFQPVIRKLGGYDSLHEEIDTLYNILNNCIDITNFPKATGVLRQTQLVDAEVLRIFDNICRKHDLTYWLDYGTLLGAVRHKGFIPWDDDLDVAMPREDYNRAAEIFQMELVDTGITVINQNERRIALSIWKAGANLDVFPMDNTSADTVKKHVELKGKIKEYRKYYKKKKGKKSQQELYDTKIAVIGNYVQSNPIWYHNPEFAADGSVFDDSTIFPLRKIDFEGYSFMVPNDTDTYLSECYGNYMGFPHGGMLHHHGGNGDPMYYNAIKHHVDMDKLIEELKAFIV